MSNSEELPPFKMQNSRMRVTITNKELEKGINEVLDCTIKIADRMWEKNYPDVNNSRLKEIFQAGFFVAVVIEFRKRYEIQ